MVDMLKDYHVFKMSVSRKQKSNLYITFFWLESNAAELVQV